MLMGVSQSLCTVVCHQCNNEMRFMTWPRENEKNGSKQLSLKGHRAIPGIPMNYTSIKCDIISISNRCVI